MNNRKKLLALLLLLSAGSAVTGQQNTDAGTGFVIDEGFETVKENCTACHSAKLVIQSSASREGWQESIRWMQKTQNLWQFPKKTENIILDYLAKHYAPAGTGRRAPLAVDEWYVLEAGSPSK